MTRRTTTIAVLAVVCLLGACTDTDPTSVASPTVVEPADGTTSDPQDVADAPEATDVPAAERPDGAPAGRLPTLGTPVTTEGATDSTTTTPVGAADDVTELVAADLVTAELVTDEPSFDVEPLRPFVFVTDPAPTVDDAGDVVPGGWSAFDASIEDALLRNGNSAASVAVSIGGEVVHAAAFGVSSMFTGEPATTVDRFRIASISKTLTAVTLLDLVEDGVVGLDEPVGQVVADHLGVTATAGAQGITVRRLLGHTSGFGKYDTEFFRGGADDCDDAARTGLRRGAGGGGYTYSNMNYCVAGVLIEALTGKPYEAAVYERVLTPLGLSGLRLANTIDPGPDEVLHATAPGRNYMETLAGAGGWIATPSDLVTILDSLDPSTPGFKPLDASMLAEMTTPVGGQRGQRGYGLGLILYGGDRWGHTGTIESTHAMVMQRGDGVTWAVTVAGPHPADTPRLESIVNRAFEAAGFVAG